MSLIICKECGAKVSDQAQTCPQCGCPVTESVNNSNKNDQLIYGIVNNPNNKTRYSMAQELSQITGLTMNEAQEVIRVYIVRGENLLNSPMENILKKKPKKKESVLSTLSAVLSLFGITTVIAVILAIIDLAKNDKEKHHNGSVFALVIGALYFWLLFIYSPSEDTSNNNEPTAIEQTVEENEQSEVSDTVAEEPKETEEEYRASCQEYAYKDVLRNPDDYIGKRVKITVKISSVHSEDWKTPIKYYFAYSDNDGSGAYWDDQYGVFDCREVQEPKLLEDDIITVYGEISKPKETTSLIVNSEELFCIDMKYVDLIAE